MTDDGRGVDDEAKLWEEGVRVGARFADREGRVWTVVAVGWGGATLESGGDTEFSLCVEGDLATGRGLAPVDEWAAAGLEAIGRAPRKGDLTLFRPEGEVMENRAHHPAVGRPGREGRASGRRTQRGQPARVPRHVGRGHPRGGAGVSDRLRPDRFYIVSDAGSLFCDDETADGFATAADAARWATRQALWPELPAYLSDGMSAVIVLGSEHNLCMEAWERWADDPGGARLPRGARPQPRHRPGARD